MICNSTNKPITQYHKDNHGGAFHPFFMLFVFGGSRVSYVNVNLFKKIYYMHINIIQLGRYSLLIMTSIYYDYYSILFTYF